MTKGASLRAWATPLTIGAFFLMAATGVLMFFEWNWGLTTVVHQWFSWIFLVGAGGHMASNIRPLTNHLKSRRGKFSVATFAVVLAASWFSWGLVTGPQLIVPVERALLDAPLSVLAALTHTTTDALVSRLRANGTAASSQQSVHELSATFGESENRLLGIVFLAERQRLATEVSPSLMTAPTR